MKTARTPITMIGMLAAFAATVPTRGTAAETTALTHRLAEATRSAEAYQAGLAALQADASLRAALDAYAVDFDGEGLLKSAVAAAWRFQLAHPERAFAYYRLRGLDPRVYTRWRHPHPEVSRALRRLRDAPEMLFALLFTAPRYAEISGLGEERWSPAQEEALVRGALRALGDSGHAAAPGLLKHYAQKRDATVAVRRTAIQALGHTGADAILALTPWLDDPQHRPDAISALGRSHAPEALPPLLAALNASTTPGDRRMVRTALGRLASRSIWTGAGGEAFRNRVARSLLTHAKRTQTASENSLLLALRTIAAPQAPRMAASEATPEFEKLSRRLTPRQRRRTP